MKKGWSIILTIVFIAVLFGAISVGVGYITGADIARITSVLENSPVYAFVQLLFQYWTEALETASQLL